jgi:hypothetical protein
MNVTPKAPPGPTALVMFAISPWGEIFLDGKSAGVSPPLAELETTRRAIIESRFATAASNPTWDFRQAKPLN